MAEATAAFSSYLKMGPPRAPEAEKACLGALMLDPEGLSRIEGTLKDWHFYEEINRRIYRCVCRLFSSGRPVDIPIVHSEMQNDALYQDSGGEAYLADLAASVGSSAHLREYSNIVREKAILREVQKASTESIEDCYRQDSRKGHPTHIGSGINELLDRIENRIFKLAQEGSGAGFKLAKDTIHEVMQNLQLAMQNKSYVTGLATGFSKLDYMTSGFQKGNFVILAARPGEGKTAMALNIAAHVALELKKPVAIYSLEMRKQEILMRMLCAEGRVNASKLRGGFLPRDEFMKLTGAASRLLSADFYIDDSTGLSALEVRARARRLSSELRSQGKELSLLIIDYLQLLKYGERAESRQQEVSEISRSLKILAQDLDIPILALSQLSRRPEERDQSGRPQLSDLRESGSLEQDADTVLLIYRPNKKKQNATPEELAQAELMVAKQRSGPVGKVPLIFLDFCTRFASPDPHLNEAPLDEEVETLGEG